MGLFLTQTVICWPTVDAAEKEADMGSESAARLDDTIENSSQFGFVGSRSASRSSRTWECIQ
jgi:hypothetical protein